jgi:hypothetical protein
MRPSYVEQDWKSRLGARALRKDTVIEYIQMPERLKKMERRVERLNVDLEGLTAALKKFLDLEAGRVAWSRTELWLDRYVT